MELDIVCFRTECSEVKIQFEATSSIKNWEFILENELDIESCRKECSEMKVLFEVTSSIINGEIIL